MDLDDLRQYRKIEAQNVAADIDGLPEQLASVWEQELKHPLPEIKDIRRVVISGTSIGT